MTEGSDAARFELVRREDVTGTSGTGVVAIGLAYPNGAVHMMWQDTGDARPDWVSDGYKFMESPDGVRSLEFFHGHGGKSYIRWVDDPPEGVPLYEKGAVEHSPDDADADDPDSPESAKEGEVYFVDEDGFACLRSHDPADEPYALPEDADPADVVVAARYYGYVNNIRGYGFFVTIRGGDRPTGDISGLVPWSELADIGPDDVFVQDRVVIEVAERKRNGDLKFDLQRFEGDDPRNERLRGGLDG